MRWMVLLGAVCALACDSSTSNPAPSIDSGTEPDASPASDASSPADTSTPDAAGQPEGGMTCSPACSGTGITCDPADGKCKPDGTTSNIGAPCMISGMDPVCGTDPSAYCNNEAQDGFPGGYCMYDPCSATNLCPIGASCAHLGGAPDSCYKICNSASDCRTGYDCLTVDPLFTSGASHKVCYLTDFPCNKSADCPSSKPTCNGADPDAGNQGVCQ